MFFEKIKKKIKKILNNQKKHIKTIVT